MSSKYLKIIIGALLALAIVIGLIRRGSHITGSQPKDATDKSLEQYYQESQQLMGQQKTPTANRDNAEILEKIQNNNATLVP